MGNYDLEIISQRRESKGRALRKYGLDGIETIGVYGEEPFAVCFRNKTPKRVEVKLAIDGTDVLTGDVANSQATGKRWVVEAWGMLELKAWPETNRGGAAFVFGKTQDSVAANTHGDLSAKGYISAAVFVDSYTPPVIFNTCVQGWPRYDDGGSGSILRGASMGGSYGSSSAAGGFASVFASNSVSSEFCESKSDAGPAVGAGEHVEQHIGTTSGLVAPVMHEIVRVRYLWWDDVKAKLSAGGYDQNGHPTGFPGDVPMANLGRTPRIKTSGHKVRRAPSFERFA
jgi:hypothetical protein